MPQREGDIDPRFDVACTTCGAAEGDNCVNWFTGSARHDHPSRVRRMQELQDAAEEKKP